MFVIILCMHPANERWLYNVTSSLIGWAHSQNDPCLPALFQVMAWHPLGDKPLSEPMMTKYADAYMYPIYIMHMHTSWYERPSGL